MNRKVWLVLALGVGAVAQDTHFAPKSQLIPAPDCLTLKAAWQGPYTPCNSTTHEAWLKDLRHWRSERAIRTGLALDSWRYGEPALRWTQSSFIQPQMMVHDRYFYDPVVGKYTVDRYLDDLKKRYGGIDAVLIWSTYPNMGIDGRNQLDMVASMPRHRACEADGRGLPPARGARAVSDDDVGPGYARPGDTVA